MVEVAKEVAEVAKEEVEVVKKVIMVVKVVVEVTERMEVVVESLNLLPSSNQDDNVINDNNLGNVRTMNNGRGGCSYKEFMASSPKDYDGKGGAMVQTRGRESAVGMTWEDFKTLTKEEFCPNNEMQKLETKFWCHVMVGAGHAAYTDRFHELARLVPHLVTLENKRIER
ncbi:reverse transcriptase domain-containing protein [Tanacetum coccineum]